MLWNLVSTLELGVLFATVTYYVLLHVIAKAKMGIFCQSSVWNHLRFKRKIVRGHCLTPCLLCSGCSKPPHPPPACNSAIMGSVNGQMCRDYENGSYFIITFLFKHNNNISVTELSVVLTASFPALRAVIQMRYFLQQILPVRQLF